MRALIVGAAYSGKRHYTEQLGYRPQDIFDGGRDDWRQLARYPVLGELHLLVKRLLAEGIEPRTVLQPYLQRGDCVILCDEVGAGVVPIEADRRRWREEVGRLCCWLTGKLPLVVRLCCGIPPAVQGELPCV